MLEPVAIVLKTVPAITAGAISLGYLTSKPVQAATLTYEMTVDVTQGNYQGTYQGSFSYDASQPLQPCQNSFVFTCATVEQNKLSVLFNFLGKVYSEKDDVDYGFGFPSVYFQNNALVGLSLVVIPPTSDTSFSVLGKSFYVGFETYPDTVTKQGLVGTISYKLKQLPPVPGPAPAPAPPTDSVPPLCPGNCESIPEPSEMAGSALAIAFLGLGLKLRRKE